MVGYTGGEKPWPTYQSIQDHTEAVRLEFDPSKISYGELLDKIFNSASPFTGPSSYSKQYQSGVWYTSQEQYADIQNKVKEVEKRTGRKVLMEISPAKSFYRAEEYHQKYF